MTDQTNATMMKRQYGDIDLTAAGLAHDGLREALEPRPYQNECIRAVLNAAGEGVKRPACVLPTGSGKTVIFSHLAKHWNEYGFTGRVLILVHRDELVRQTVDKLQKIAPALNVGIVQAKQNEHVDCHVIVASVQTVRKLYRLDEITESGEIGLVIVDECHHATAESYVTVLNALGCFEKETGAIAVGFTATLARSDMKSLGDVWQSVVFRMDILDMIPEYLTDVSGKMVTVDGFSLSDVAMRGGDYATGSLSDALLSADAPDFIADAYMEHAADKKGIVFTPSVDTAEAFTDALCRRGIVARMVWGAMDKEARRDVLRDAHAGRVQVLVNCMVLTEGFDWPQAEVAVIARPTTSAALYVQMVGRILRKYPGKKKALVLDIVGATQEHRLATLADLTSRRVQIIQEGESLTDAVRRERKEGNAYLRDYVVLYEDVDLFQRSGARWLQTYEGIWFVTTNDTVYFVWPGNDMDTYHVGHRPLRKKGGGWVHKNVSLDIALQWAEQEAMAADSMLARKNASWRRRREPATDAQKARAARLRLKVPDGITKREISDMMDVKTVSGLLDPSLKRK